MEFTKKSILTLFFMLLFTVGIQAGISVEITFHHGSWSLNLLKEQIENLLNDVVEEQVKEAISDDFPGENHVYYDQSLTFNSSGKNTGLSIRLYPGGKDGTFSLGVGYYKTRMEFSVTTEITDELDSGKLFSLDSSGNVTIDSYAYVVDFRWDFFPKSRITPYFTLGGGVLKVKGTISAKAEGTYKEGAVVHNYSFEESEKIEEIEDAPKNLPVIIMNLGLRANLVAGLNFFVDAGIYNGFLFKGGISYRF